MHANTKNTEISELSAMYFKAIVIKVLQRSVKKQLKNNEKNKMFQQRNKNHKEKSNENFGTKNTTEKNK